MAEAVVYHYETALLWTGNRGPGTTGYLDYDRDHVVSAPGKASINASSDPVFHGDPSRWNPEDLLVSAVAQCHLLWYLHLAADAGIVVTSYRDHPVGTVEGTRDGVGQFSEVVLHPEVTVTEPWMVGPALRLHEEVGERCAIARSVRFPVRHQAVADSLTAEP